MDEIVKMNINEYQRLGRYWPLTHKLNALSDPTSPEHPLYHAITNSGDFQELSQIDQHLAVKKYEYFEQKWFENNRPGIEEWYRNARQQIDKLIYMYSTDPVAFKDDICKLHELGWGTTARLTTWPIPYNQLSLDLAGAWTTYTGITYDAYRRDMIEIHEWDGPTVWYVNQESGLLTLPPVKLEALVETAKNIEVNRNGHWGLADR